MELVCDGENDSVSDGDGEMEEVTSEVCDEVGSSEIVTELEGDLVTVGDSDFVSELDSEGLFVFDVSDVDVSVADSVGVLDIVLVSLTTHWGKDLKQATSRTTEDSS